MKIRKLLFLGLFFCFSFIPASWDNDPIKINSEIFSQLISNINDYYVDEIDADEITRKAIDAALKSLDPYSYYISEKEQAQKRNEWKGILFAGIGVNIIQKDSNIVITEITENYPAQKAGLRHGDIILSANDFSFYGLSLDSVVRHLKGEPKTEVRLKIRRDKEFSVTLLREEIKNIPVGYAGMIDENIGYIQYLHFLEGSATALRSQVERLKTQGAKKLIIDVRGNTGGLVDEAVKAVNVFIPKNKNVVSFKGKAKEWNTENKTFEEPMDTLIPLAVITDNSTISAGEIFAGAIQDYDRGVIIGRRTFGKGFVQGTRGLPYGSSLYMTSARYHTPSGRCIQELDYRKRDAKGNATKVSDSLKREFTTKNGRKVISAGGINPDVEITTNVVIPIVQSLKNVNFISEFANQYRSKNEIIPSPEKFALDKKTYDEFLLFLSKKKYAFSYPEENALKTFVDKAKEENHFKLIENDFSGLQKSIEKIKIEELEKFRKEITAELEKEIVARYYYNSGRIRFSIKKDKDVSEAVSLLNEQNKYFDLLKKK